MQPTLLSIHWVLASALALVGLSLLVTRRLLHKRRQDDIPWWHSSSGAMADSGSSAAVQPTGGKLVGGSRQALRLDKCAQCDETDASFRCARCRSVAYCSKACQQKHWVAGHKSDCKKLRKAQQADAQLGVAAAPAATQDAGSSDGKQGAISSKEAVEESNSIPPLPTQVLYPSERYAELAAAPPQRKQPLGLQNVGNSCYANSLLQSLLATPSFAAYLVSGEHSRGCLKPSPAEWCALCELEKLAVQAYDSGSTGKVLNPKPLLRHVKRLGKQFQFGRQEDSHELFLRLVEAIEAVQLLEAGGKARFDLRSRETTLVHHVFAGYTRNQVECMSCGHVSRTFECCTSLTLEVGARVASLEAALARFTAAERLDGDNRYKCDGCKSLVAAQKSTRVEAAPHCLQVCLKRFAPGRYGKITTKLSFPEQLDLAPYMAAGCTDSDPVQYSLYAVVVHIDWGRSTDYGHYIAYVRSGASWFQCDDATVTPVAAAKVLSAGAYLLFYERQAPRRVQPAAPSDAAAEAGQGAAAAAAAPADAAAGAGEQAVAAAALEEDVEQYRDQPSADSEAEAAAAQSQEEEEEQQQEQCGASAAADHQQEQQAAAARARTEVEALIQQQQRQEENGMHADIGADSDDASVAGSFSSAASDLLAEHRGNRFDLLGFSGSDSDSGHSSVAGTAGTAGTAGSSAQGMSRSSSTSSGGMLARRFEEEEVEEAPLLAGRQDGGMCSTPADEQQAQQQESVQQAVGAQEHAAAGHAAAAGQQAAGLGSGADQHQGSGSAAPLAQHPRAGAGRDAQWGFSAAKGNSAGAAPAAGSAAATPCAPEIEAEIVREQGKRVLRVTVALQGVAGPQAVSWRLEAGSGSTPRQTLKLCAQSFERSLPLPVRVASDACREAWAADRCQLTLTWPTL